MSNNDNSYIRIQEATKRFGKTRQTFYNYINKGELSTKKIHNKTYVSVRDLQRITGNFVGEDPDNAINVSVDEDLQETIEDNDKSIQYLNDKIDQLRTKIDNIPNDFSLYTQQATSESKHYTDTIYSKLQGYIQNVQQYVEHNQKKFMLSLKKQRFVIGYTLFLVVNVVVYLLLAV